MIFETGLKQRIWLSCALIVLLSYGILLIFSSNCSASYKYHTVKRGETLYKISKLYGVSIGEIKKTNRLSGNEIYPGQRLLIPAKDGVYHEVKRYQTLWRIAKTYNVPMEEIIRANNLSSTEIKEGQRLFIPGAKKVLEVEIPDELLSKVRAPSQMSTSDTPLAEVERKGVELDFSWPVKGEIIGYFGEGGNKGIDIAAPKGSLITAPADGVVYFDGWAGKNGQSLGQILIIYHKKEDVYTCYIHNSLHLVKKGDRVEKGQPIAQVGTTGVVDTPCLHFEIRKGAKPVNPLDYLP